MIESVISGCGRNISHAMVEDFCIRLRLPVTSLQNVSIQTHPVFELSFFRNVSITSVKQSLYRHMLVKVKSDELGAPDWAKPNTPQLS